MAKVKKTAVVTGVRNVKASKKASKDSGTISRRKPRNTTVAKPAGRASAKRAASRKPGKVAKKATRAKTARSTRQTTSSSVSGVKSLAKARARARIQASAPVVRVHVKPLEPRTKCGAGTSVQYLLRVDETVDGRTTTHMVFFDRHGWYCEHGRNCPAVGHAKKYQGHIARAS